MADNESGVAVQRTDNSLSAQPCGCDPGCKPEPWVCLECQKLRDLEREKEAIANSTEYVSRVS